MVSNAQDATGQPLMTLQRSTSGHLILSASSFQLLFTIVHNADRQKLAEVQLCVEGTVLFVPGMTL